MPCQGHRHCAEPRRVALDEIPARMKLQGDDGKLQVGFAKLSPRLHGLSVWGVKHEKKTPSVPLA